jgi:hypothetical protein
MALGEDRLRVQETAGMFVSRPQRCLYLLYAKSGMTMAYAILFRVEEIVNFFVIYLE